MNVAQLAREAERLADEFRQAYNDALDMWRYSFSQTTHPPRPPKYTPPSFTPDGLSDKSLALKAALEAHMVAARAPFARGQRTGLRWQPTLADYLHIDLHEIRRVMDHDTFLDRNVHKWRPWSRRYVMVIRKSHGENYHPVRFADEETKGEETRMSTKLAAAHERAKEVRGDLAAARQRIGGEGVGSGNSSKG